MTAPALASSASFADSANSTSRTIAKPSGTASGDWLYLFVSIDGTSSITTPTGFTEIFNQVEPASNMRLAAYEREADGTEGATFTIATANEIANGWIVRVTGADSTAALDVISTWMGELNITRSVGVAPCPEAYAACTDGSLILQVAAFDDGSNAFSATPSGYTALGEVGTALSGTSMNVAHKGVSTEGYVGTPSWTYNDSVEQGILLTLVIRASAAQTFPAQPVIRCMSVLHQPTSLATTVQKPYGTVDNDLLVLIQTADSTLTIPAGFTSIQSTNNAAAVYHAAHYKVASSEGSSYSCGTSAAPVVAMMRIVGASTSSPISASSVNTNGTADRSPSASTITPANDNCLILWSMGCNDDEVTTLGGSPSGYTVVHSESNDDGADVAQIIGRTTQTTAAATGAVTSTNALTAAEQWVAIHVAIAPAATVTPVNVSDTPTVSLTESVAVQAGNALSDTTTLSLTEAIALAASSSLTDTVSISLAESMTISGTLTASDAPTVSLGTEAAAVQAQFTVTDSPTITLGEAVTITVVNTLSDAPALSVGESIAIAGASSLADAPAVSLGEAVVVMALLSLTDAPAVSLGEAIALAASSGLTDSCAVSLGESMAVAVIVAVNDNCAVSLGESASVFTGGGGGGGATDDGPRFMNANVGTLLKK